MKEINEQQQQQHQQKHLRCLRNDYYFQEFSIEFCLQSSTTITLTNVRYSNDGGADYVEVKLDNESLGTFWSLSKTSSADEWNQ